MAGIYLHIPFCKQACTYCDFHFSTNRKNEDDLVEAMVKEIEIRAKDWESELFETVYFGGGSPSILSISNLEKLLTATRRLLHVSENSEITLEANPDDMSSENLIGWKKLGINRLSVGLQSFQDHRLQWMNRAHSAEEALECVQRAQGLGFDNISIDLIYALPDSSLDEWKNELAIAARMNVQHFSAYILTVEEKTALHHQVKKGMLQPAKDEKVEEQYRYLCSWAEKMGFEHYEISNFSKENYRSQHNGNYWNWVNYLGIGPAAHSFQNSVRSWNIAHNINYIKSLQKEELPARSEELSKGDEFNESIMLGLRKKEGINTTALLQKYAAHLGEGMTLKLDDLTPWHREMLEITNDTWSLKESAWLLCDDISAALFYSD